MNRSTVMRFACWGLLWLPGLALAVVNIQSWQAPSGARVFFVESHALPMVDIEVDFAAGTAFDPPEQAGLAALTRGLLDGGAAGLDEAAIADRLADLGARLGGGADKDRVSVSLRSLSDPNMLDGGVALLASLLARPDFPAGVVDREKARVIAGLKEAEAQPGSVASRRFAGALYGAHPYGVVETPESIGRIDRDAIVAFHRAHFVTARASITLVGDLTRARAEALAQALTVDLPRGDKAGALPKPELPSRSVVRIPHASAQAHILVGTPVLTRDDPDYFPLLVGNYVLGGGGFVSRLTQEVREKRGLAYSVYSYMSPSWVAGPFQMGLQTRGGQTDEALKVVDETLSRFLEFGPTPQEVAAARDNLINGFGLRLDSNRKVLDYVAMIGFYGLPLNWLETYPLGVDKVTPAAIRDAFRRRVQPAHLVTVVVGGDGDTGAPVGGPKP